MAWTNPSSADELAFPRLTVKSEGWVGARATCDPEEFREYLAATPDEALFMQKARRLVQEACLVELERATPTQSQVD